MNDKKLLHQFEGYPFLQEKSRLEDSDIKDPYGENKGQSISETTTQCERSSKGCDKYNDDQLKIIPQSQGKHLREVVGFPILQFR
jgi:hypothetical protein